MNDDQFRQHFERLKQRASKSRDKLNQKFPHVGHKLAKMGLELKDLRRHSARMMSAAALAGAMMVASPNVGPTVKPQAEERQISANQINDQLKAQLATLLAGHKIGVPLSPIVESQAHEIIQKTTGINAVALLEGQHLLTTYGYMGAEQHLPRYPGDTVAQHDEIQKSGITPGLGGWRYFSPSKKAMTQEAYMREKYYVAVPVMYLPNWRKDTKYLSNWYKYRKVLVVNPSNGKSILADVADAGPAAWTGKQFGGSPEVMAFLGLNVGKQKGAVLMFFVDDKDKPLALGPVSPGQAVFIAKK